MSQIRSFDGRPLWQRAKWTITVLGLVLLGAMFFFNRGTGGSADVDRDLVLALGAILSLYLGAEGAADWRLKPALANQPKPAPKSEGEV